MNSQFPSFLKVFLASTLFLVVGVAPALASTETGTSTATETSRRSEKKLGAYLGVLGDPAPTAIGLNLAYNVADYLRASIGYGDASSKTTSCDMSSGTCASEETGKLQTFGAGLRAMMPGWSFTPVLGVSLGYMKLSGDFTNVQGLTHSGFNAYGNVGFDYQARSGFNVGFGYNFPLGNKMESNPYLNLGWFFDLGV
jgi:outer membrane autotransporter protein